MEIALTVFDGVVADPPSHVIELAAALCRDRGLDAVLSIGGGGSAPHTAKLVVYLAKSPGRLDDIYAVYLATGERLPLLRVPATVATGSEVKPIAIVATRPPKRKL
ncbi:iron-containing alcohol dehydrogenase [Rhizobium laguerreae]|uniref:iron-containing alcohol dehydrogenase n=1 Tax=Rhizobium laguerreae TaxID=1076926 RepID=UPI001FE63513|nr:iron-containing alcohol dehydrogenase [Rhizobium laguerreae]